MNCYSWFWRRSIVLVRTSTQSCLRSRCSQSRDAPLSRAWCTPRPPAVNYPSHTRHNLSLIISKSRLAIKWKFRKKLDGCIVWNTTIHDSARSGQLHMHKLFTSCIRRCLVSRVWDWVMSALSFVLHIFSFQYGLLFFHVGPQAALRRIGLLRNIGHKTLPKISVGTFFVRGLQCRQMILNWF